MIKIGDVERLVIGSLGELGRDIVAFVMEDESLNSNDLLRYQGNQVAYCKYCYTSHKRWHISDDHFPPTWVCEHCNHAMRDKFMEIGE